MILFGVSIYTVITKKQYVGTYVLTPVVYKFSVIQQNGNNNLHSSYLIAKSNYLE